MDMQAFYGGVNVYSGNLNVERGILTIDGKRALTAKATGSATIDPVSMAGQTGLTLSTITATGAALGDFVLVSSSADTEELTVTASVISANTVEIRLYNGKTSTAVDLPFKHLAGISNRIRIINKGVYYEIFNRAKGTGSND